MNRHETADLEHTHHTDPDRIKRPVEARQGTGPRSMFTVLTVSLVLAVIAAIVLSIIYI